MTVRKQEIQRDFLVRQIRKAEKEIARAQWNNRNQFLLEDLEWTAENWRRLLIFYDNAIASGQRPNGFELKG